MIDVLGWLVRRVGGMTLLILVLFASGLATLVWLLNAVVRGLDLDLLLTLTLVGAVSGWLLARSRMRPSLAALLGLLIGLVTTAVRVGQLGDKLLALTNAVGRVLWDAQFGRFHIEVLFEPVESLRAASFTLLTRLQAWGSAAMSGQPAYEPVAWALLWGFVVCLVALWGSWKLRRTERAFDALLPVVLLVAFVSAYSGRGGWVMFLLLGIWFGLLVAVPYFARQRRWERDTVPYAEGLGYDLVLMSAPIIIVILTIAVIVPVISPQEIARWVRGWTESTPAASRMISNSFGIEPAPRPSTELDRTSSPGLPRSHLLGASPDLLKKLALTVQVDQAQEVPVRYWLGTTYDEYTGHGWFTSGYREQTYAAGERVEDETRPAGRVLQQTVRIENAPAIVYAAGGLERVDQPFRVAWRQPGDMFGAQINSNSNSYRAESYVPAFDADALRVAGQAYPNWIGSQYLKMPERTSARVFALARDLTATEPTAYDRARAIELYLRTIPYSLDVPLPPGDRDVVDYFLFDLRRGYCDYYATAMAMLARAAGLPARIAVGYAAGEYDPTTRTYRVTEAAAHAWTQIYFPNYGWVDFEPTSGRAPIAYDAPLANTQTPPEFGEPGTNLPFDSAQGTYDALWFVVPGLILIVGLIALGSLMVDTLVLRLSTPSVMIHILYRRMVRLARLVGLPITPGLTPNQIGAWMDDSFAAPADSRAFRLYRPISDVIHQIVGQYVQTIYGGQKLSAAEAPRMIQKWEGVRLQLALVVLWHVWQAQRTAMLQFYQKKLKVN